MKVKELVKWLGKFDQDSEVVLQSPDFGRKFSLLENIEDGIIFDAEHETIFDLTETAEENGFSTEVWKQIWARNPKGVVLIPG